MAASNPLEKGRSEMDWIEVLALVQQVWKYPAILGAATVGISVMAFVMVPEIDEFPLTPALWGVALITLGPIGAIALGIMTLIKLARS